MQAAEVDYFFSAAQLKRPFYDSQEVIPKMAAASSYCKHIPMNQEEKSTLLECSSSA